MSHENDTAPPGRHYYRTDVDGRDMPALTIHDHGPQRQVHGDGPEFGANDRAELMVPPVLRRIEALKTQLAETAGFDPKTGAQLFKLTGKARALLEAELFRTETITLPATQKRAAAAEAWHAANPQTAEDKLRATMEQRHRIQASAQQIADQLEAEREANRILRERDARRRQAG